MGPAGERQCLQPVCGRDVVGKGHASRLQRQRSLAMLERRSRLPLADVGPCQRVLDPRQQPRRLLPGERGELLAALADGVEAVVAHAFAQREVRQREREPMRVALRVEDRDRLRPDPRGGVSVDRALRVAGHDHPAADRALIPRCLSEREGLLRIAARLLVILVEDRQQRRRPQHLRSRPCVPIRRGGEHPRAGAARLLIAFVDQPPVAQVGSHLQAAWWIVAQRELERGQQRWCVTLEPPATAGRFKQLVGKRREPSKMVHVPPAHLQLFAGALQVLERVAADGLQQPVAKL